MRMRRRKEGLAEELLEEVPYIFLTIAVLAAIWFLMSFYSNSKVNVEQVQVNVFFNRMMHEPNSIMCTDLETGRVHPGIICMDDFNNAKLDNAIVYSYDKQLSALLTVADSRMKDLKTAYYNEVWFNRLGALARSGMTGLGSARIYDKTVPIIYRLNGVDSPGFLKIKIVVPD